MLARMWRGATSAADADAYLDYLRRTGLRGYAETPGNRGALVLRRVVGDRAEFVTLSFWESLDAVRGFSTGEDVTRAVFYPADDRFLVARDRYAEHFEVADGAGWTP